MAFIGFLSKEHEKSVMKNHPKLWKKLVKKYGHHKDFSIRGKGINNRHVGGTKKSSNRRVIKRIWKR